jgi:predicted ester cyclase
MQGFKGAFPDLQINITHQVATENEVVSEFTARGTQTGPMMTPAGEIPPTGRIVDFTVCEVWSVKNGKVASLRNYQDSASIMRQLGLV